MATKDNTKTALTARNNRKLNAPGCTRSVFAEGVTRVNGNGRV
jgi:hypothetical protein